MLETAFQAFVTTREGMGGTGMGLAMVNGFCRQSGGIVYVSNTHNGAVVEMILPAGDKTQVSSHVEEIQDFSVLHGKHCIVLEDNIDLLMLTTQFLTENSMKVTAYDSLLKVREGLSEIENADFLLSDIILGDGRGYEIAEEIRKKFPNIRLVFVSGYMKPLDLNQAKLLGPVISKPYSVNVLLQTLVSSLKEV